MTSLTDIESFLTQNLGLILYILLIAFLTFASAQIVTRWFNKIISKERMINQSKSTKFEMIKHILVALIYLFGLVFTLYIFPPLKALSATIFASAGLISIIIGIAAQDTFGNLISGLTLAFFQPISLGDFITIGDTYGEVINMNLRHTTIKTADNRRVLIPNADLNKQTIINWTAEDPSTRCSVLIQISYESDIDIARQIMIEEVRKNKSVMYPSDVFRLHKDVTEDVRVRLASLSNSSVDLRLDFWVYNKDDAFTAECAVREAIKKRIDLEERVSIPYPHTTIIADDIKTAKLLNLISKDEYFQSRSVESNSNESAIMK